MHDVVMDEFLAYLEGESIHNISDAISSTGNAKWIYFFLLNNLKDNMSIIINNLDNADEIDKAINNILDIDIEYLVNSLISIRDGKYLYRYKKTITEILKRLRKTLDKNNIVNVELATLIDNILNKDLTDEIINTRKLKYIYKYACDIKDADIKKIEDAVIKSKNAKYIYLFAKNVSGADIDRLTIAILDTEDAQYMYLFAKAIDTDKKILEDAVADTLHAKYIYLFTRDIKGVNVAFMQDMIIETDNIKYKCEFARNIDCDITKFEYDAIDSLDGYYIYTIASIKEYDTKELSYAIKKTKNAKYIYLFAKNIKYANPVTLGDAVIRTNDPEYMYLYARDIHGADIGYFETMIFKPKNIEYIYKFFKEVPGVDVEEAIKKIKMYNLDPENKYLPLLEKSSKPISEAKYCEDFDMDEYIDGLLETRDIEKLYIAAKRYKKRLDEIINAIIEARNPKYICKLAYTMKWLDKKMLENIIIEIGDPEYIYKFALNVSGANIKKLGNEVLKALNPLYIYLFAKNIHGVDLNLFINALIEIGNPEYLYLAAINIYNIDIKIIEENILKIGNMEWIYKFFRDMPNADIYNAINIIVKNNLDLEDDYTSALVEIVLTGDDVSFIKPNKEVNTYIDELLKKGNPKKLLEVAIKYRVRLDEIADAILISRNPEYIYKFIYTMKWYDKDSKFENMIIELANPEYIYKFALNVRGANINKLMDAMIRTYDAKYIKLFGEYVSRDIIDLLNLQTLKSNFKNMDDVLATPYDLYEILLSTIYNDNYDINVLSKNLNLPCDKLINIINYLKIKYMAISFVEPVIPICKENIPSLGRKYDDVYKIMKYFKDDDINDLYISNLVEKYYLEENQEFLDSPKVKEKNNQH